MEYRRFGKTGLHISVFTLGGMRFHKARELPYHHLPTSSIESTKRVIQTAFDAGINIIESARGYGKSERLIGTALQRLNYPRDSYYIMSKASPIPNAKEMRLWIDQALQHLQIEKLDLFALHGINQAGDLNHAIRKGGSLEGVKAAQKEGLVGSIGFSTHAPLPIILETINSKAFDFVNLHYYFFRQGNQAAIIRAEALDMGVLIISPNDQGGLLYTPPDSLTQQTAPLHPAVFNERWLLAQKQVHTLSIGVNDPTQMALHQQSLTIPSDTMAENIHPIAHRMETCSLASPLHHCGVCRQCLPCPKAINIPEMFRLLHLSQVFGMTAYGKYRYTVMHQEDVWSPGAAGSTCNQCGDCLPRCPEKLDIPKLLMTSHETINSWQRQWRNLRPKLREVANQSPYLGSPYKTVQLLNVVFLTAFNS